MPLINADQMTKEEHRCDGQTVAADPEVLSAMQQGKLKKGQKYECPVCKKQYRFIPAEWQKIVPRRPRAVATETEGAAEGAEGNAEGAAEAQNPSEDPAETAKVEEPAAEAPPEEPAGKRNRK